MNPDWVFALLSCSSNFPFDENALMYHQGDDFVNVVGLAIYDVGEDRFLSWDEWRQSLDVMGSFAREYNQIRE